MSRISTTTLRRHGVKVYSVLEVAKPAGRHDVAPPVDGQLTALY